MTGRLNSAQPYAIGLFRIVIGLLFACHGAVSLLGVLGGMDGKGATVETGAWPNWYAAVIELVGGSLVLLGLGTRIAAFIASGAMAYAYFKVHQPQDLWPIKNRARARPCTPGRCSCSSSPARARSASTGSSRAVRPRPPTKRSSEPSRPDARHPYRPAPALSRTGGRAPSS